MKNRYIATLLLVGVLAATGCRKKKNPDPDPVNPVSANKELHVNFANFAGNDSLKFGTAYTNAAKESFTVSMFNYYITNIRLTSATGSDFVETESYHLVRHGVPGSMHFHVKDVPQGSYTGISFLVGVDSARNVSGAQTGALDVSNGMFWTWNTGYIMAKLEGKSDVSTEPDKSFKYHPGGFRGANSVLRTVKLDFPAPITLSSANNGDVTIKADMLKWFEPNTISIATVNTVMNPGPDAMKIADNYAKMFSIISAKTTTE